MTTFPVDDTLPHLIISYPTCSHCGEEVEYDGDGGCSCNRCLIYWDRMDEDAMPYPADEGLSVCEFVPYDGDREGYDNTSTHTRWSFSTLGACILPSGHQSIHMCPYEATAETIEMSEK